MLTASLLTFPCVRVLFLQPLYFDVVSQAVAVYTYNIALRRQTTEAPDGGVMACVDTPKGVTQCV